MPLLDTSRGHGIKDCRTKRGGVLNEGKLDLLLSAHLHQYYDLLPSPGVRDFPLVIGGAPTPGETTRRRVDVTRTKLTLTVLTDDDKVVHTLAIPAAKTHPTPPRLLRL